MAAFFELIDEISDLILAFVFYSEAGDVLWAAHGMFVLIGLNRFVQFVAMLALGQGLLSAIEALVGIKTITDTYRMIADGPNGTRGGQLLSALRAYSLALGIIFESFPQMMLQVVIVLSSFSQKEKDTNTGVLITQLVSVAISSASIGLSIASLHVDNALACTIPGKEIHISAYKFVPRKGSRQTMVLLSLMGVTSLHIILAVFGFGALFSFAPAEISVSITIGNILIISCLRYWAQDAGIYGLDLWNNQSDNASIVIIPLYGVVLNILAMIMPLFIGNPQHHFTPIPVAYGWLSSLLIIICSLFGYINNVSMQIVFGVLLAIYFLFFIIFFIIFNFNIIISIGFINFFGFMNK